MANEDADLLKLTDFMDLPTLQEIQDSFAAVAYVKATITDAAGVRLTQAVPTSEFLKRQGAIAADQEITDGPQREGREYVAPIMVNNQRVGAIRMSAFDSGAGLDESKLAALAEKFGLDPKQIRQLDAQLIRARGTQAAAIQFLFLLANAIAQMCYQEFQLRQQINEMSSVYNVSMMLSEAYDLPKVLQRAVQVVCQVMQTRAASLRLIDPDHDELVIKAVYNLSQTYLDKGPILLSKAEIDRVALSAQGYEIVRNMATDPRVIYPHESVREGIVSMLSVGMRYKGKAIGVLRVYTGQEQTFSQLQIDLMKSVAAQAAAAIENARLLGETLAAENLEKQVHMAAEVQKRMIPRKPPVVPGIELAAIYVPCYELGGDFYDFISLPYDNLGLAIADISGKGVPASLVMASVRAALRAQVDNVYYLYEVMKRVNKMVCRDTEVGEFVTLFYGVLDAKNRRLTYCNAGHPAGLILRGGSIIELAGDGTVFGVNPDEEYKQTVIDLKTGDLLLLYTDGLPDAMNFEKKTFTRQRLVDVFRKGGPTADAVAQNILWEIRRFVGLSKPSDDLTMIVARVT